MTARLRRRGSWTVGSDTVQDPGCTGGPLCRPEGRLHAVSGAGLVAGRAVCLAPVTLLDPLYWSWPDHGDDVGDTGTPLCWICLALTICR